MAKHAEKSLSVTIKLRLLFWTRVTSWLIKLAAFSERKWRFALYEQIGVWTKTFSETISDLEGK
jgi:hypothetical protein